MITGRPTQQDVAKIAGVHRATVSLVLKNHPSIPESTHAKIRRIMRDIGYVPDPMLSALAAYRSRKIPRAFQGTLAWVRDAQLSCGEKAENFRSFKGADDRALSLGYKLQEFVIPDGKQQFKKLRNTLIACGIRGLLVTSHFKEDSHLNSLEIPAVALGVLPNVTKFHTVTGNPVNSISKALSILKSRNFSRVGVVLPKPRDGGFPGYGAGVEVFERMFESTFGAKVPVMIVDDDVQSHWQEWRADYDLEAVVAGNIDIAEKLRGLEFSVPQDVGVAVIGVSQKTEFWSGVDLNCEEMGRIAIDVLIGMIHNNEAGIPGIRRQIIVEPQWRDGMSIESAYRMMRG